MNSTANSTATSVPASRRRGPRIPDPRTITLAVGLLAFIFLALWVSDITARETAQSLIARTIQRDVGTTKRPEVHLRGTFFLPQVVRGRYDHVSVDVSPLQAGPLRLADVQANLRGLHLSFHDLLRRNVTRVLIDDSRETATVRYDDLNRYLTAQGDPVSVTAAAGQQIRVTGTLTILGQQISASADARVTASHDNLEITPTQIDTGNATIDGASRALLGQRLTITVPLQALPFGQHVTRIAPRHSTIVITATGHDLTFANP